MKKFKWKKVLLKISGESLMGNDKFGINPTEVKLFAKEISEVVLSGLQICIVVGGGNIYRGISSSENGMDRTTGDYMGMLATVMNSLAIQNALEQIGIETRVQSALPISAVCEPYIKRRAIRHMEKGRVVIFAAGTGNPYFTTDTAAALRASEMNCEAIIKATLVDGVYSADPKVDKNAIKFDTMTYLEVLSKDLKVMDASSISLARENKIPIIVCSIVESNNLTKVLSGNGSYTIITD
ncbi:UMP kinase [Alphaproteobacteria bacterium]|nr:UMP kinase [Alphaproteobacteria bacterium]MDB9870450.1 UMP kinase [Alphaproteobacteria bacterium]